MNETYTARALPWAHGWELHVDGVGVTQVRVLANAEQQVRDLVESYTGQDVSGAEVVLRYDLGGLENDLAVAQEMTAQAAQLQVDAAEATRKVVLQLREAGISVSDIAHLLGRSRGRVSQLLA